MDIPISKENRENQEIDNEQIYFKLKEKARNKVIHDEMVKYFKLELEETGSILPLASSEFIKKDFAKIMEKTSATKPPYIWLTVNFREHTDEAAAIKAVNKAFSKKWLTEAQYLYVYEWGKKGHFHVHALIARGEKRPAAARTELASSFSKLCDTDNWHCFYFALIDEETAKNEKLKYLLGIKQQRKLQAVTQDRIQRQRLGLEEHIGGLFSDVLPSLVSTSNASPCPTPAKGNAPPDDLMEEEQQESSPAPSERHSRPTKWPNSSRESSTSSIRSTTPEPRPTRHQPPTFFGSLGLPKVTTTPAEMGASSSSSQYMPRPSSPLTDLRQPPPYDSSSPLTGILTHPLLQKPNSTKTPDQ